jgi:hypothetical protein
MRLPNGTDATQRANIQRASAACQVYRAGTAVAGLASLVERLKDERGHVAAAAAAAAAYELAHEALGVGGGCSGTAGGRPALRYGVSTH